MRYPNTKERTERSFYLESRIKEFDCMYMNEYVGPDACNVYIDIYMHVYIHFIYIYIHIYIEICMRVIILNILSFSLYRIRGLPQK